MSKNQPLLPTSCILLTPTAIEGIKTASAYKYANSGTPISPQTNPKAYAKIALNRTNIQSSFLLAHPLNVA